MKTILINYKFHILCSLHYSRILIKEFDVVEVI